MKPETLVEQRALMCRCGSVVRNVNKGCLDIWVLRVFVTASVVPVIRYASKECVGVDDGVEG